jgi:mannose-1-phosphate guanylyltransferase
MFSQCNLVGMIKADHPSVEHAPHVGLDTQGAIVYAFESDDETVTIGLEDIVIVRDGATPTQAG